MRLDWVCGHRKSLQVAVGALCAGVAVIYRLRVRRVAESSLGALGRLRRVSWRGWEKFVCLPFFVFFVFLCIGKE